MPAAYLWWCNSAMRHARLAGICDLMMLLLLLDIEGPQLLVLVDEPMLLIVR